MGLLRSQRQRRHPRLPVICKISKLACDFLVADAAIGGTIFGCCQRTLLELDDVGRRMRDNTPTIDLLRPRQ
jgi:hypothetical protein